MTGLVSLVAVVVMAACVLALPSSLMGDVKQAEMSHVRLTNKVKRAQEVIMFGNQQNRGGDGHGGFASLPRADKRGVEMDENALQEVTERPRSLEAEALEEPKVMALFDRSEPEYATRLQNAILKPEYFGDPALTDMRFYDLDERRKRETFRTASKRSSRGLSMGTGRAKRDLDFDPEELLALLSYWESERRNKQQHPNRNMYSQFNVMDSDDMEMMDNVENGNELTEEEEPRQVPDGWLDGPVAVPSRHFSAGSSEPWGRQRTVDDRRKRFMVSKRRPQDGDMYSLAQMLNGPQREVGGGIAYRRRRNAL